MSDKTECCVPGDFTVTPVHTGYLIGQVTPQLSPGPWWSYVATVREFEAAVNQARALARHEDSRAWFFDGGDSYRPIPTEIDAPFPKVPTSAPLDLAARAPKLKD